MSASKSDKVRKIFVFGSNTEGIHGSGAARHAVDNCGAIFGQAEGLQGDSYAIVTKDLKMGTRSVSSRYIREQAQEFYQFAKDHPDWQFQLTAVGCGLAGFTNDEIAPMFAKCLKLDNVDWPPEWAEYQKKYDVRVDKCL